MKLCILHAGKVCDNCGECDDRCELDPNKICDNCFQCLDKMTAGRGYSDVPVSAVYTEEDFLPGKEPAYNDFAPDKPTLPYRPHYYDVQTLYGLTGTRRARERYY